MYKIDISRFRNLNDKLNDLVRSCFEFCSEYKIQKDNSGFDIKDVYKVFEDNGEEEFIKIIKNDTMSRKWTQIMEISDLT